MHQWYPWKHENLGKHELDYENCMFFSYQNLFFDDISKLQIWYHLSTSILKTTPLWKFQLLITPTTLKIGDLLSVSDMPEKS